MNKENVISLREVIARTRTSLIRNSKAQSKLRAEAFKLDKKADRLAKRLKVFEDMLYQELLSAASTTEIEEIK